MKRHLGVSLALLVLTPAAVQADSIDPILNLFDPDRWLPAAVVMAAIILVESRLMMRWIGQVRFRDAWWRSAAINLASSITGSVVLLGLGIGRFSIWNSWSLVLPLFCITLLTEIPLLHLLFRRLPLSWLRAVYLGLRLNVVSYLAVFTAEIAIAILAFFAGGYLDQKERAQWIHPELLARSTGLIYSTESRPDGSQGLRFLEPQTARWVSLPKCPMLDPDVWDVEGKVCAFLRPGSGSWREDPVVVASLPDFNVIQEINLTPFREPSNEATGMEGRVSALSLSPDTKKLALLVCEGHALAYKNRWQHYFLGGKCKPMVLSVESGKELRRCSRWASESDGLGWLPDSESVLFPSFRDEALYRTTASEVRGSPSSGVSFAEGARFARNLYAFNLKTGETRPFSKGRWPVLSANRQRVLVREGNTLRVLNPTGEAQISLSIARLASRVSPVLSPDGNLILAQVTQHLGLYGSDHLVLVDLNQPSLRHLLPHDQRRPVYGRYDWTAGGPGIADKLQEPAAPSPSLDHPGDK